MREEKKIRLLREKLRQLQIELNNCFRDEDGCCGLTLAQCHTLTEIGYRQPVSLITLASCLGLDPSTLSRSINGLVLLGLVNRSPDVKDRRYIVISLTEQGQQFFSRIETFFNTYFSQVLELIPDEKRDDVLEGLVLLADAVRQFNQKTSCCSEDGLPEKVVVNGEK